MKLKYIDVLRATLKNREKMAEPERIEKVCALSTSSNGSVGVLKLYGYVAHDDSEYDYDEAYFTLSDIDYQLQDLPITLRKIVVEINSYGGDVYTALSIIAKLDAIQEEKNLEIETHVIGVAASASGLIALAYPCRIEPHAQIMIHQCMASAYGNKDDMARTIQIQTQVDTNQVKILQRNAKKPKDVESQLVAETWYTADDVVKSYNNVSIVTHDTVTQDPILQRLTAKVDKVRAVDVPVLPPTSPPKEEADAPPVSFLDRFKK